MVAIYTVVLLGFFAVSIGMIQMLDQLRRKK
jgi:hypothetical protein